MQPINIKERKKKKTKQIKNMSRPLFPLHVVIREAMNGDVYISSPFVTRDLLIYVRCHIKQFVVFNYDLRGSSPFIRKKHTGTSRWTDRHITRRDTIFWLVSILYFEVKWTTTKYEEEEEKVEKNYSKK